MSRPPKEHSYHSGIEGKVCPHCEEWKPLIHFPVDNGRPDSLASYCRDCLSAAKAEKRAALDTVERRKTAARGTKTTAARKAIFRWAARSSPEPKDDDFGG